MSRRNILILFAMFIFALGAYFVIQEILRPKIVPSVINPGFESDLSGWNSSGSLESDGHSGQFRLTHGAGVLETTQTLAKVPNGWYTLRAWVRSNGEPKGAVVSLFILYREGGVTNVI